MPIYTRTGDNGTTSLYGGKRVSKADLRVEAYGTVDELNSAIGVTIAEIQNSKFKIQSYNSKFKTELTKIQHDLFDIGSQLANPSQKPIKDLEKRTKEFENLIDEMIRELPVLRNFVLPGGGESGSMLHMARAICRRAERKVVELMQKEKIESSIVAYFNRLSDLLFTMARFANQQERQPEIIWKSEI